MKKDALNSIIQHFKSAKTYEDIDEIRADIIRLISKVRIMFNYDQQNSYHQYNLWEHCVHTVLNLPKGIDDNMLYLAALLHDIGKPYCQCTGKRAEDKDKHYYGHPLKSMEIVRDEVIPHLEELDISLSTEDKQRLLYYVEYHDDRISLRPKHLQRHLKLASFEEFQKLMLLQVADAKAHVMQPLIEQRIEICGQWTGDYGRGTYKQLFFKE